LSSTKAIVLAVFFTGLSAVIGVSTAGVNTWIDAPSTRPDRSRTFGM